jgi:hypothetical protein
MRLLRRARLVVLSIAALTIAAPAKAQSWGVLVGRIESNYWTTYDGTCGRDTVCGFGPHFDGSRIPFGVFWHRPVNRWFAFEPELLWTPKGSGEGSTPVLELDYVEVPLLFHVRPFGNEGTLLRPFLLGGPALGYLVNCDLSQGAAGQSCTGKADPEHTMKAWDISGVVGIGLDVLIPGGTRIGAEVRYEHSLVNVGTTPGATTLNHATMYLLRWYP